MAIQDLEALNLLPNRLPLHFFQIHRTIDLESDTFTSCFVCRQPDYCISASADVALNLEFVEGSSYFVAIRIFANRFRQDFVRTLAS